MVAPAAASGASSLVLAPFARSACISASAAACVAARKAPKGERAAAGVAVGVGPTSSSPVLGGPPLIVSQPTTPLESPLVNRRATPGERRDLPRRVADRSVAMRGRGSPSSFWAWLWIVLAVVGGTGAAYYYYQARGFAPGPTADPVDSGSPPPVTAPPADSAAAPVVPPPASRPAPARSRPAAAPAPAPDSVAGDSGGVRLVGLPRGSTVLINERPVTDPVTRLPPGRHALAVSAPRFNFFSDTIVIRAGDTLELTPQLTPLGAAEPAPTGAAPAPAPVRAARCSPGTGYNSDGSCFDDRPKPVNAPFVPVPETVEGTPRPSLLWVKVSAEGRTVDVRRLRPSNEGEFERAVQDFVWTLTWHPALKDGAPVEAWTQMLFPPQPIAQLQ